MVISFRPIIHKAIAPMTLRANAVSKGIALWTTPCISISAVFFR